MLGSFFNKWPLLFVVLFSNPLLIADLFSSELKGLNYSFEQISLDDGLTQSTAKCALRDHTGLLWIGTKDGLNCFDGLTMTHYFNNPSDSTSIPSKNIFFIVEDSRQNIWIGTEREMVRYDRANDCFRKIKTKSSFLSFRTALQMDDRLLFGSKDGILVYSVKENRFQLISFKGIVPEISSGYQLLPWRDNEVLVGSRWMGLFICNLGDGVLTKADFYPESNVMCMYRDRQGRYWISPYQKGVYCFSRNGDQLNYYNTQNSGLNNNLILDMIEVDDKLWIGTDGGGINVFDYRQNRFDYIVRQPDRVKSIPVNSIRHFYKDSLNHVWIGTLRAGLLGIKKSSIFSFSDAPLNSNYGLSDQSVLSFFEDSEGVVWIGTDGGGINSFDPANGIFKHFALSYGKKITGICPYSNSELLVNAYNEGLMLMDRQSGRLRPLDVDDQAIVKDLAKGAVGLNLRRMNNGSVYVFSSEVFLLEPSLKRISKISDFSGASNDGELKVVSSNDREIVFHGFKSFFRLDLEKGTILPIVTFKHPALQNMNCAVSDQGGGFWIGTSEGLFYYNEFDGNLKKIETSLFRPVNSLGFSSLEKLWIGSGNNLFSYDASRDLFMAYDKFDGVVLNEFLPKPVLVASNSDVYMGGVTGFIRIVKETDFASYSMPKASVLRVLLDGKGLRGGTYERAISNGRVEIPYNYRSLLVHILIKDDELLRKKIYRYFIDGYSDQPVESFDPMLDLSGLKPGKYVLRVQCQSKNGAWTDSIQLLSVRILPPWYFSWWFIVGLLLVLAAAFYLYRQYVLRGMLLKMAQERQLHKAELDNEKIKFLINLSHELRTPLTLVYAPLQRLIDDERISAELKPLFGNMFKQLRFIRHVIDQVLDFRKTEERGDVIHYASVVLPDWMADLLDEFRYELEAKSISLIRDWPKTNQVVQIDPHNIRKVVYNLMMNAIKFSPHHSTLSVVLKVDHNLFRVSVSDQGSGLSDQDLGQLFERFYQGSHQKGGSGIGLTYSKLLVEMHGGTIGAYNNPSGGATFWFELPVVALNAIVDVSKPMDASHLSRPTDSRKVFDQIGVDFSRLKIMIVDDEKELTDYLKDTLEKQFAKILVAHNGTDALRIVRQEIPDLIISDVMMPEMDGFQLCHQVKSDLSISHIPVVLLTARHDDDSQVLGYKLGADSYLAKPFSIDLLLYVIGNLVRLRQQLKERYQTSDGVLLPEDITFSNADEEFMKKLIQLIDQEIDNPALDVDLLVGRMAMSRAALYAKVKAIVGYGVNDFINEVKVKKAMALLKNTNIPIVEIASMLGFSSQSYFSTLFKQITKRTPTAYRQNPDQ